jgi:hypothetical protein
MPEQDAEGLISREELEGLARLFDLYAYSLLPGEPEQKEAQLQFEAMVSDPFRVSAVARVSGGSSRTLQRVSPEELSAKGEACFRRLVNTSLRVASIHYVQDLRFRGCTCVPIRRSRAGDLCVTEWE